MLSMTRPPIRSLMLGELPLYGMWMRSTLAWRLKSSIARCGAPPGPEEL